MSARKLADYHRQMLRSSAISDMVIDTRGYFSIEKKGELEKLGFGPKLQHAPTLVVPVHGVVPGEPPWYMHRPDDPPLDSDGKVRKYLIPSGRRMSLDVHPLVHAGIGNPRFPLFITEGVKKVDALVTAGAKAVIGLAGVANFRGKNATGGKTMLADWEWGRLRTAAGCSSCSTRTSC
jgi:hypothetical protein